MERIDCATLLDARDPEATFSLRIADDERMHDGETAGLLADASAFIVRGRAADLAEDHSHLTATPYLYSQPLHLQTLHGVPAAVMTRVSVVRCQSFDGAERGVHWALATGAAFAAAWRACRDGEAPARPLPATALSAARAFVTFHDEDDLLEKMRTRAVPRAVWRIVLRARIDDLRLEFEEVLYFAPPLNWVHVRRGPADLYALVAGGAQPPLLPSALLSLGYRPAGGAPDAPWVAETVPRYRHYASTTLGGNFFHARLGGISVAVNRARVRGLSVLGPWILPPTQINTLAVVELPIDKSGLADALEIARAANTTSFLFTSGPLEFAGADPADTRPYSARWADAAGALSTGIDFARSKLIVMVLRGVVPPEDPTPTQ